MTEGKMTRRQMVGLVFVGLLSPLVRLVPAAAINLAQKGAWLSPVLALAPAALYCAFLSDVAKRRKEGEGMAELIRRALGERAGKVLCAVFAVWLAVYSGFMLRAAAERMLSSVYDNGNTAIFILIMAAAVLLVARGRVKHIAATAEVFAPLICAVLALCFLFSIEGIRAENVLPITARDAAPIVLGAAPITDVFGTVGYFTFLLGSVKKEKGAFRTYIILAAVLLGVTVLMLIITVGTLSAPVAVRMQNAFFIVVRTVSIFRAVERIEVIVIAVWVVTDFVYLSALVMASGEITGGVFPRFGRKRAVWAVCIAAAAVAFIISPDAFNFKVLSEKIVPFLSAFFVFILLPGVYFIGRARKKI